MNQQFTLSVQDTNQQALAAKISAIRRGYFSDPYAQQFASFRGNRDILMHRGYWARVHLVKKIAESFIKSSENLPIQIISLGCGLETLWFNLMEIQQISKRQLKFIEIDLPEVIQRKVKKIERSKKINDLINKIALSDSKFVADNQQHLSFGGKYHLISCDISDVASFKQVLNHIKIDFSQPTLLYAECVLSYIQSKPVDDLLKFIRDSFRLNWMFDYEMYNPNDRFGKMMVKNFEQRGCPLIGIHDYPSLSDQKIRFQKCGYQSEGIQLDSMDKIYYNYIDKNQRLKIEKLEMLDELQEWNIIMGHYFGLLAHNCLGYSSNGQIEKNMINQVKMKKQ